MLELSVAPFTELIYLTTDQVGTLTEAATCRTDNILGLGTSERIVETMFNDYISCYSPLSAEVGDEYRLASLRVFENFVV